MQHSNPNGESFDPDGIPQRGQGPFWMSNHPVHDRPAGI
jgi:hypothetical protein